jgi:hypothetical protein
MNDLEIFPFSMTIYYPQMGEEDDGGKIPLYIRIIPRGDMSSLRADTSTLELMTVTFFLN